MFNTQKQKRDRSPKERREEIESIIEEYVNPINRELMEKSRPLNEMSAEIKELRELKTGISEEALNRVKLELKLRTSEASTFKSELGELKDIKIELNKVQKENVKLKQQIRQEWYNKRSNVNMTGFTENQWETDRDCEKKVLDMQGHAGISLPTITIELAYRVGKQQKYKDRAILAKFLRIADKDNVLQRKGADLSQLQNNGRGRFPSRS